MHLILLIALIVFIAVLCTPRNRSLSSAVECRSSKPCVAGSNPAGSTKMINLDSIIPLKATSVMAEHLPSGRGDAAIWYPDGNIAAEVYGHLGALPDAIDALEMAKFLARAPEVYKALVLCEHKIDQYLQGQYQVGTTTFLNRLGLGAALATAREALNKE